MRMCARQATVRYCVAKVVNEKGSMFWLYIKLAEVVHHKKNAVPNLVEMQGTSALSVRVRPRDRAW